MSTSTLRQLGRYAQIARLFYKYSGSDVSGESLKAAMGMNEQQDATASHDWDFDHIHRPRPYDPPPAEFADDLEELGPTFIKLGQLLSTRPDFISEPYREALARLQDDNQPIDARDIFRQIESELGEQPEYLFSDFSITPLAVASLGQVHQAKLKDGREVIVKVLRPGIENTIENDLQAMERLASLCHHFHFADHLQLPHLVASLRHSLQQEIDYRREAQNSRMLHENLKGYEDIRVPLPIEDYCSRRVITMEYVEFSKITEIAPARLKGKLGMRLAEQLFRSFLYQVLVHGAFHADPHPGNIGLTKDDQIALLDHGLVVKVSPRLQSELIKLLLAISEGDGAQAARLAEHAGVVGERFDRNEFSQSIERIVATNINKRVDQIDAGSALMAIQQAAGQHDLKLPEELILLGRALMHLDEVVGTLDSTFDPNRTLRQQTMEIMRQHSGKQVTMNSMYQALLETTEFTQKLPQRANQFAELLANNELKIRVDAFDEKSVISGLNKVANRIAAGLIIAAMIVAAALMMQTPASWTLLGYPGLALIFLFLAAAAGTILVWRVVISDNWEA